jgi:hypothetical protein
MTQVTFGSGAKDDPWLLKTPSQTSELQVWKDEAATPARPVVQVGTTQLSYDLRGLADCVAMLKARVDWVALGNADEGKPCAEGSVEAWARDAGNPLGGYYGLRKGHRGRFANCVTPVLGLLGQVEVEHGSKNNRVRAL